MRFSSRAVLAFLATMAIVAALSTGSFLRLYHLDRTNIWDADVASYSIYADKYAQIMKLAMSDRFAKLIAERRASGRFQNIEAAIADMTHSDEWKEMASGIRQTDPLPNWYAKMLFILSAAAFQFLCSGGNHSLLFFTAAIGILVVAATAVVSLLRMRYAWSAAAVTALVAISPMAVGYSRIGFANIAAALFVLMAIACLAASIRMEGSVLLILCGGLLGVGALYHPSVILWFPMAVAYEALAGGRQFRRTLRRVFHLGIGFLIPLLVGEILYLDAWVISLLFGGSSYRPFFYSLFLHDVYRASPVPLFYLEAIFRYEGPLFLLALILSVVWAMRRRKEYPDLGVWAFFSIVPLVFFSVLTQRLPPALRNMVPVMVPAYFLIVASVADAWPRIPQVWRRRAAVAIIFAFIIHTSLAIRTDLDNASYDVKGEEITSFIRQNGAHLVAPATGTFFIENLLGGRVDRVAAPGRNIFFYRGYDDGPPDSPDAVVFRIDAYNTPMFYLENPKDISIHDDEQKLSVANLLYFTNHLKRGSTQ